MGGKSVIKCEDSSLVDFFRKEFDPGRCARANFCREAFDGGYGPSINFVEKFGRGGLIDQVEVILGLGYELFVPAA